VAARVRDLLSEYGEGKAPAEQRPTAAPPVSEPPVSMLGRQLAARVPMRLDPGRRAAVAVGVAVLAAALITGLWVLAQRPRATTVSATSPIPGAVSPVGTGLPTASSPSPASSSTTPTPSSSLLVVDVAGKVRRPGLYRLPPGSRVADALEAAGGARVGVDLTSLNLAAMVADGQQILVGVAGGAAVVPGGAAAASTAGPTGLVDLNTATLEQLDTLPGVGPVTAQHILDWRTAHGSFSTVDQLDEVSGIGPAKLAELQPLVTV
jgi:competence protein ComEA